MRLIILAIYAVTLIAVFRRIKVLPYVLGIYFVLGCMASTFSIDTSLTTLAGITIMPSDVLTAIILIYFFKAGKLKFKKNSYYCFLLIYTAILFVSLALGLLSSDSFSMIIANIRKYLEYVLPWLILSFIDLDIAGQKDKLLTFFEKTAVLTVIICIAGWGMYFAGLKQSLRVIPSGSALLFALFALYKMYMELVEEKKSFITVKTTVYFIVIILLQHNSVWVATAVGMVVIMFLNYKINGTQMMPMMIATVVIIIIASFYFVNHSDNVVVQSLGSTFSKFQDMDEGTIGNRRERWAILLGDLSGKDLLIGTDFSVGTNAGNVGFSAHNAYVAAVLHSGYIGGACFILALVSMLIILCRKRAWKPLVIVAVICIYWYAYEPDINTGCILGIISYLYICKRNVAQASDCS